MDTILDRLIGMSRRLGDPANDYVILGEGNTSAKLDDGTFWVKASGTQLATADRGHFVRIDAKKALSFLDADAPDDEQVKQSLRDARVDPSAKTMPSVETFLHAVCLDIENVNFVGHTHPTAINFITCSRAFDEALAGRLFPDEIVICGANPLLVPYIDPGLPLARELHRRLIEFRETRATHPKAIYLQNHGFIALGATEKQVEDITQMAVKAACILAGTYQLGGPRFLRPEHISRIETRPDEHYRQRILKNR